MESIDRRLEELDRQSSGDEFVNADEHESSEEDRPSKLTTDPTTWAAVDQEADRDFFSVCNPSLSYST